MAEVLGAVASGLAVAEVGLKVGGTVWKLKQLWQQVHDVPETIQDLMKQIEIMDPVLCDHETKFGVPSASLLERSPTQNTPQAILSAEYCRKALRDLRSLVEELDRAIESEKRTRRTFAKIRVVLKKDMIKEFQGKMDRATKLLQCTQVNYLVANATMTVAMVTDIWTAVQQQLDNRNSSSSIGLPPFPLVSQHIDTSQKRVQVNATGVWHQASRISMPDRSLCFFGALAFDQSRTETGDEATYAIRFQLPRWLSHKVWDVIINRACFGWQATLSTWNIVPDDSPGLACAANGDLDGLIDLFNRGLASPRDCQTSGHNLLSIAIFFRHAHIVEYLCNTNLDQPCIEAFDEVWRLRSLSGQLPMDVLQRLVSRGLMNALADAVEDSKLLNRPMTDIVVRGQRIISLVCANTCFSPAILELCFRKVFPLWHHLPPRRKQWILMMEWRLQLYSVQSFLLWAIARFSMWTADALRQILSPERHIRPIDVQAWSNDGASILHQVFLYFLRSESDTAGQDWKILLKEVIEASEDVHHRLEVPSLNSFGLCTALEFALMSVLARILTAGPSSLDGKGHKWTTRRLLKRTLVKLQMSMSIVASCGYDLLEFGRREAKTWLVRFNPDRNPNVGDNTLDVGLGARHAGFPYIKAVHYGSIPKDWYFEMDFYYEDYAGDFWHLLENPHLYMMPGAWIDED